jgi:hypothetical protein
MMLTLPLPLRDTTAWPKYAQVAIIPHRYGRTTGALLPYDASGLRWVWADHSVQGIDTITLNGAAVNEWQWRNTTDLTGHPIALVEFGQAQQLTAALLAMGRGKLHAITGALLDSPASVVFDVLANIAGLSVVEGQLSEFQAECGRRGLIVAGSIEAADTAQTVVRSICDSVGAVFCADAPRLCRVWPGGDARPARAAIALPTDVVVQAKATLANIVNDVTMQFGFVAGAPKHSIRLAEPASIKRFGSRPVTLQAQWIVDESIAYNVVRRYLAQYARPNWVVEAAGMRAPLPSVCDDVHFDHPVLPIAVDELIQLRVLDLGAQRVTVTFSIPAGDAPA